MSYLSYVLQSLLFMFLQDLENKFNKTCDNLRQEYEKLKVKKLYLDAIQILDDIKLK